MPTTPPTCKPASHPRPMSLEPEAAAQPDVRVAYLAIANRWVVFALGEKRGEFKREDDAELFADALRWALEARS